MVFSSYSFIFCFFPLCYVGYVFLSKYNRDSLCKLWLVSSSIIFYAIGQPDFVIQFCMLIIINYTILAGIRYTDRRWVENVLYCGAFLINIGVLFYYKYTGFFVDILNGFFHTAFGHPNVTLPIGISFFTFQILAFTMTVHNKKELHPSLLNYSEFVTFFPQLIVGPVVRHHELMPQIQRKIQPVSFLYIQRGILLFSVGCAKKVLLANPMINYAAAFYGGNVVNSSTVEAWIGVTSYVFAYYFDFSGYIDMARGLGYCFGFELPINFDSPYKAIDFADFWRRWNITISQFFNDSVFKNLFHFGDGVFKLILATMATFLVSGIWHGAGWHYIAWGLVNGILVCVANIRTIYRKKRINKTLAILLTFFAGLLIRVLFDCKNLAQAVLIYKKMFDPGTLLNLQAFCATLKAFLMTDYKIIIYIVIAAIICFFFPNSNTISRRKTFTGWDAVAGAVLLAFSIMNMTSVSTFLYFNF